MPNSHDSSRRAGTDSPDETRRRAISLLEAQQEASLDGILVIDENRKVASYNDKFLKIWRVPMNRVSLQDDQKLLNYVLSMIADRDAFIQKVEYLYDHPNETSRDEIELRDGRYLDRYSAPVVSPAGEHFGRMWLFREVTERKVAEQDLIRTASLLEAVQEASIDGILVIDENRKVVSHNKKFEEIWRIPRELAAQRDDEKLLGYVLTMIENCDAFVEKVEYLYDHPEETSRDEIELRDGRHLERYSAPVVSADGDHFGRVWFFRDVPRGSE